MTSTMPHGLRGPIAALIAVGLFGPATAGGEQSTRAAHAFAYVDINPNSETHGQTLPLPQLYADRGLVLNFIAGDLARRLGVTAGALEKVATERS